MTSPFTKKRIVDLKQEEDTIDIEYLRRLQTLNKQEPQQLKDLIRDYEDFLPEELFKFKNCDLDEFKELLFQIRRFLFKVANKQPVPMEPTEAIMFLSPPLLTLPRAYAQEMTKKDKQHRYWTWGMAWFQLTRSNPNWIQSICQQASRQTRQIIKIKADNKDMLNEYVDTHSITNDRRPDHEAKFAEAVKSIEEGKC
jgi:hypothetical protein